jgi:hypothetical protein
LESKPNFWWTPSSISPFPWQSLIGPDRLDRLVLHPCSCFEFYIQNRNIKRLLNRSGWVGWEIAQRDR